MLEYLLVVNINSRIRYYCLVWTILLGQMRLLIIVYSPSHTLAEWSSKGGRRANDSSRVGLDRRVLPKGEMCVWRVWKESYNFSKHKCIGKSIESPSTPSTGGGRTENIFGRKHRLRA
jgi:hypothetical protein